MATSPVMRKLWEGLDRACTRLIGFETDHGSARAILAWMGEEGAFKLRFECLSHLGGSLPGAMSIASRAFGVTSLDFMRMLDDGIDITEFLDKFGTQLLKEFPNTEAYPRLVDAVL